MQQQLEQAFEQLLLLAQKVEALERATSTQAITQAQNQINDLVRDRANTMKQIQINIIEIMKWRVQMEQRVLNLAGQIEKLQRDSK